MATRYDILPKAQRDLLPGLAPLRLLGFVLYGGTAIALRLGHRASVDFDFFTDRPMDRAAMLAAAPFLAEATTLQDEPEAWTVLTREPSVKVSFFAGLGFGRVGMPSPDDEGGLLLASLDDLLGHKLKVLLQRVETKDYRDIVALLESGLTLENGLGAACALFANFPLCEAAKALVYFGDGDLAGLSAADRATLVTHVDRFTKPAVVSIASARLDA